jgi:hypothetical protein
VTLVTSHCLESLSADFCIFKCFPFLEAYIKNCFPWEVLLSLLYFDEPCKPGTLEALSLSFLGHIFHPKDVV